MKGENTLKFLKEGINRIRLEFKVICLPDEYFFGIVLIESDWNLKDCRKCSWDHVKIGINRIRLEFKA